MIRIVFFVLAIGVVLLPPLTCKADEIDDKAAACQAHKKPTPPRGMTLGLWSSKPWEEGWEHCTDDEAEKIYRDRGELIPGRITK